MLIALTIVLLLLPIYRAINCPTLQPTRAGSVVRRCIGHKVGWPQGKHTGLCKVMIAALSSTLMSAGVQLPVGSYSHCVDNKLSSVDNKLKTDSQAKCR